MFENSPPLVFAYSPLLYRSKNLDAKKFYNLLSTLGYQNFLDLYSKENRVQKISKQYLTELDSSLVNTSSARLLLFI